MTRGDAPPPGGCLDPCGLSSLQGGQLRLGLAPAARLARDAMCDAALRVVELIDRVGVRLRSRELRPGERWALAGSRRTQRRVEQRRAGRALRERAPRRLVAGAAHALAQGVVGQHALEHERQRLL